MNRPTYQEYLPIIKDRESGLTFQDIADKLGVTRQRAQQIYSRGKLLQRTRNMDPFWGLPIRAVGTFESLGLRTKEQIRKAVASKRLHPLAGLPNYRWTTHNKVLEWLKLPVLDGPNIPKRCCPKCGHKFQ